MSPLFFAAWQLAVESCDAISDRAAATVLGADGIRTAGSIVIITEAAASFEGWASPHWVAWA